MKWLTLLALLLTSCAKDRIPDPGPIPTPPPLPAVKAVIAVWGAPWCSACKSVLPRIQNAYSKLPTAQKEAIEMRVYVPTGMRSQDPATQEVADFYVRTMKMEAKAIPDPKWKLFNEIIGGSKAIPAGALLKPDGSLIKRYYPGQLDAEEIVDLATRQ